MTSVMENELAGIATYQSRELLLVAPVDPWAVRDEAARRQAKLTKQLQRLAKKVADIEAEMSTVEQAYRAALRSI